MHVLQYIATIADDVDEASRRVRDELASQMGNDYSAWYDWFITGGGRFSKDELAQYDENYQNEIAHQSEEDFQVYLKSANMLRGAVVKSLVNDARKIDLEEILDGIEEFGLDYGLPVYSLYPLKKLYENFSGTWNSDSHYYDMEHDSIHMVHMKNSIDNGEKNWYIVPVDFHF